MEKTRWFFILTVVIGFLAWFLIPFGGDELWDSWWYYGIFLLIIISIGFFMPTRWWLWPIGLYLGQLVYLIYAKLAYPYSEASDWWIVGIMVLTFNIPLLYALCAVGRGIRALVKSKNNL